MILRSDGDCLLLEDGKKIIIIMRSMKQQKQTNSFGIWEADTLLKAIISSLAQHPLCAAAGLPQAAGRVDVDESDTDLVT